MENTFQKKKLRLGLIYGIFSGLAFAAFAWGADAIMLARAHAAFYYVKFLPGAIICIISSAITGWLTMRIEKHIAAIILWGLNSVLFSWLVIWLPFKAAPTLITMLDPKIADLMDYSQIADLFQFQFFTLFIVGVISTISGLLEINLVLQAMLSSFNSATLAPLLVCFILFGIAGSATDHMINTNLREPVQVVDNLIQFAADNAGVTVSKDVARKMHLSSVKLITDLIQKPRQLTLIRIDQNLGQIDVLVDFEGIFTRCTTIYAQPTDCIILTQNP